MAVRSYTTCIGVEPQAAVAHRQFARSGRACIMPTAQSLLGNPASSNITQWPVGDTTSVAASALTHAFMNTNNFTVVASTDATVRGAL